MGLFASKNDVQLKKLRKIADKVDALDSVFSAMSDDELKNKTVEFKSRYASGESLDDLLPEAYATVREASKRVLGMKHFYCQIIGGIVLHQGRIAEMRTGEGKTLVATLPAYLNALTGDGMHVVTVNEYLAQRDSEWMGKLYKFLGLTVGVILAGMDSDLKKKIYECDIVYGTNSEFGFDYLRDNLAQNKSSRVQRKLAFALVDEVDSILIDEARTPLIISGRGGKSSDMYVKANRFAKSLKPDDYIVEEKERTVRLSETGIEKAEREFGLKNLADYENGEINAHIYQAIKAHYGMKRDVDYMVKDGQIYIIDEFTGRAMEGRRYSEGLHQAIEAKEGVQIRGENRTVATITYQNLFRMYKKLSGMTGTAITEEEEFEGIYNLDVVVVPTNKPVIRRDENDRLYLSMASKIKAIIEDVVETHKSGQPVLVGTVSVEKSEFLSNELKKRGVPHNVLNAKEHEREADIIAQAGKFGAVTIATNMAGRGTDIVLGGNPAYLAENEMEKRHNVPHELVVLATGKGETNDEEVLKARELYQTLYLKHKEKTDAERQKVLEVGGLRIIGTERHESRRIDNQLRGRSGRQGDPGSSAFYLSVDDDLIRIFGGEKMKSVMGMFRIQDTGAPITNKIFTSLIESAQKRRESALYAMRKHVLNYDDVMNTQRQIIYKERARVLDGEDMHEQVESMLDEYMRERIPEILAMETDEGVVDAEGINHALNLEMVNIGEDYLVEEDFDLTLDEAYDKVESKIRQKLLEKRDYMNEVGAQFGKDYATFEREMLLRAVDRHWMDHIDAMDSLRKGIGLRAYGGTDPVIAYKAEGTDMFNDMTSRIKRDTARNIMRMVLAVKTQNPDMKLSYGGATRTPVKSDKTVGRNDPCPCGSGKKYKNCCGKN